MKEINLTESHIQKMTHAIGFAVIRVRKGHYEAYRNRYVVSGPDEKWDYLVSVGYANKAFSSISKSIYYYVTRRGLDYLERILGVRISVSE